MRLYSTGGPTRSNARALAPWRCGSRQLGALLLAASASCAAPGADIHLAPLYTRLNTADARIETEFLGGLGHVRRRAEDGSLERIVLGPIWEYEPLDDGYLSHFLAPLGYSSRHGQESRTTLYPLFIWGRVPEDDGSLTWSLAALPGLLMESNPKQGTQAGLFPLIGKFDDFVTFDSLVFALWPLFVYSERDERVSYYFLWPLFGWTKGGGESSIRLGGLYSRTRWEGRFDRTTFLWPLFHYQRNHHGGGREVPETSWMVWPLYGRTTRGSYRADTVLWPFFGYASDPDSGFWALDAPWPFVRFQRSADVERSRVWPFYSYSRADNLETTSFLWPLIQFRHERSASVQRDSTYVIPLWQSWDRRQIATGATSGWRKLFPIFQYERDGDWERGSFPTLDPFWRNELIDRHYGWMWKLWEWEAEGPMRRERAWLGLWRRERGLGEDRRSLTGLWSSRTYERPNGAAVSETSLFFGLLRWRTTEESGLELLPPAFPGPGWPAPGSITGVPVGIGAQTED